MNSPEPGFYVRISRRTGYSYVYIKEISKREEKITKYAKSVDDYVIFGELYGWTEGELHVEDG